MSEIDEAKTITIHLTITAAAGSPRVPLRINSTATSTELRNEASKATHIPLSALKLIFRGRLIVENDSNEAVAEYKLEDGSVLHCMGKPEAGSNHAASATSSAASASRPTSRSTSTVAPYTISTVSVAPLAAAAAAAAAPPANSSPSTVPYPVSLEDPLKMALQRMRTQNSAEVYKTAVTTLNTILKNIIEKPLEEKYRRIKKSNPSIQKRIGNCSGSEAAILACGFVPETVEGEDFFVLRASPEAWPALQRAKITTQEAVNNCSSSTNTNPNVSVAPTGSAFPNFMPPMMGSSGGDMMDIPPGMESPQMQQALQNIMSNPQEVQAIFQDPMVQNEIRNDPRFANNPMFRGVMEEVMNNPQALEQMAQLFSTMQGQNIPGVPPAFNNMFGMTPSNNTNAASGISSANATSTSQQAPNHNSSSANDEELTEEELIAEAIRRSLEDQNQP